MLPGDNEAPSNLRPVATLALSLTALMPTHDQLANVINTLVEKSIIEMVDPQDPVSKNSKDRKN
jgi:hypothetical protein